ncbi:MAG: MerR family transcriptional regulator [Parvularculaceae bacterium]
MAIRVKNEIREYTPKEAAEASGVSTTLQRDWRRREVIQPSSSAGWARFGLDDVIRMAVLNRCSAYGLSVKFAAKWIAPIALLPVYEALEGFEGAIGGDVTPAREPAEDSNHEFGRYIASIVTADDDAPMVTRVHKLAQLEGFTAEYNAAVFCVLDCHKLAREIFEKSALPLFHVTVTEECD